MYKRDNELIYSPSDLNAFLQNECVTWLDRFDIEHPGELRADEPEEEDELIRHTGEEHERSFLSRLDSGGSDVTAIDRDDPDAFAKTIQAIRQGREVIYQARLQHGEFAGWSDFLFRVEGSSDLGGWHYEVWDTKLARSLKPYFAIQLCCYSEMLNAIQAACLSGRVSSSGTGNAYRCASAIIGITIGPSSGRTSISSASLTAIVHLLSQGSVITGTGRVT